MHKLGMTSPSYVLEAFDNPLQLEFITGRGRFAANSTPLRTSLRVTLSALSSAEASLQCMHKVPWCGSASFGPLG